MNFAHICMFCLSLLNLTMLVYSRPTAQQKRHKLLAELWGEELASLLSAEENVDAALDDYDSSETSRFLDGQKPEWRSLRDTVTESQPSNDRVWLRFFNDFMSSQKMFRGRTKKAPSRGCFGMKLDRIGALSGLGC
ncbi:C-type natriuretic peptide-like [Protopterus annectens]|uniref:C-type natriuretic peptide-like n=1 Tax=Protopterus annectens TaxID=7888 RepID=UPI001CFBCF91|nr:C-type natriuretic peptide-like [Protopterus annectens]